jgi:peptidoglycan/xylan/chitin deacetylase (PgdA/CDA1 family)
MNSRRGQIGAPTRQHRGKRVKKVLSGLLVYMGRLRRWAGVPVLLYHSVDTSGSVISISPEEFRLHMTYLKQDGYQTMTLHTYVDYLNKAEKPPDKMVVLTFDDGFKNNYAEALPILLEYGFTGTVFVSTDFVGKTCTWEKNRSIPDLPMLSWDEMREMRDFGMEFGSHSCSHHYLTRLSRDDIRTELRESKLIIEGEIKRPVRFFCHPYGDVSEDTQRMAKESGYAAAFGSLKYSSTNSKQDLYNLKRVGTGRFSCLEDFKAGVLGTYDWYVYVKEFLGIRRFKS